MCALSRIRDLGWCRYISSNVSFCGSGNGFIVRFRMSITSEEMIPQNSGFSKPQLFSGISIDLYFCTFCGCCEFVLLKRNVEKEYIRFSENHLTVEENLWIPSFRRLL